ncbi:hypothetical protein [Sphingomonas aracearum]|uniref:Uncharacterized protein n=1 Tax=Sphingomonas aracearum TaxID=2283317 RepID=A0A369VZ29_9SPHN|nr:hypothetical protein [Sphingomonas aracearum]RDE06312.1 hypothetical protein DVW87_00850 [Sphingomonas aracearum]
MALPNYDFLQYILTTSDIVIQDFVRRLCMAAISDDDAAVFGWSTVLQLVKAGWVPAADLPSNDIACVIANLCLAPTQTDDADMANCPDRGDGRLIPH